MKTYVLDEFFTTARPNRIWVSDISYIKVQTDRQYLTAVLALYLRQVAAWAFSEDSTANFSRT